MSVFGCNKVVHSRERITVKCKP